MKDWNQRVEAFDLTGKPFIKTLLARAPQAIETIERRYGFSLIAGDFLDSTIRTAIVADILHVLMPPLFAGQGPDKTNGSFPRDRVLVFVCSIWFFTAVIPRVENEGHSIQIEKLADQIGSVVFAPYGQENVAGLIKIGIQYWKELGAQAPSTVIEWHKAFAQMIFIHYEALINDAINIEDLDLDATIGKMVTVFLSMNFTLPEAN